MATTPKPCRETKKHVSPPRSPWVPWLSARPTSGPPNPNGHLNRKTRNQKQTRHKLHQKNGSVETHGKYGQSVFSFFAQALPAESSSRRVVPLDFFARTLRPSDPVRTTTEDTDRVGPTPGERPLFDHGHAGARSCEAGRARRGARSGVESDWMSKEEEITPTRRHVT